MASQTFTISGTSPAAAGNAVLGTIAPLNSLASSGLSYDLSQFDGIAIQAAIQGATGGTLDVYIQMSMDLGVTWTDMGHYTQLAAAAPSATTIVKFSRLVSSASATTTGDAALAANTFITGEWGDRLRIKLVAGAGTSAGALQTFKIIASNNRI